MADVNRETHVLGAQPLLLRIQFCGCGESSELPREEIGGDRSEGNEEDNRRQTHEQVRDDEAGAHMPQQVAEGPAPDKDDGEDSKWYRE